MALSKRGLVDKVKRVAARAGTRGARALVETAVVTARTVDAIQSRLQRVRPGLAGRSRSPVATAARSEQAPAPRASSRTGASAPAAGKGRTPSASEVRRAAVTPRGAIESGRPVKTAAAVRKRPGSTSRAVAATTGRETGRKAVPGHATVAKRGTAKKRPELKARRGQKRRH